MSHPQDPRRPRTGAYNLNRSRLVADDSLELTANANVVAISALVALHYANESEIREMRDQVAQLQKKFEEWENATVEN